MLFSVIIFIIDQLIKIFIGFSVNTNSSFTVINNFLYISHVHNYGAAFSILYGNRLFLVIVSVFALCCIYYFLLRNNKFEWYGIISYSLLIGGILGNLFDRIIYGYVVDYLDFYIFGYNFPVFNLADVCIVCSVLLIVFDTLRGDCGENKSR